MTDEIVASHIYEVLSDGKELSENDIQKAVKTIEQDDQQVHRCLSLLRDRGLVCVQKTGGSYFWSLPSDDADDDAEEKGQILEESAIGGHSTACKRNRSDCDVDSSPSRKSSDMDRYTPLSSYQSVMNSYDDITKYKYRSKGGSNSFTCTRPMQQREADSKFPQRLVNPTGDHGARSSQAKSREESPIGKACHDDRLLPSNHIIRNSSAETTKSNSRSSDSAQASDLALVPLPNKENPTTGTLTKYFDDMKIEIPPDTRVVKYTDLKPEAQECYSNFKKILEVLQKAGCDVKPAEIAKKTGIGDTKKSVNSQLYFLEKKGIVKKSAEGSPSWRLVEKCITDEKMLEVAVEFYKHKNPGKSADVAVIRGSADSRQGSGQSASKNCKSHRGTCVSFTIENHYHHHTHFTQVGSNNTMHVPQSDGISRVDNG